VVLDNCGYFFSKHAVEVMSTKDINSVESSICVLSEVEGKTTTLSRELIVESHLQVLAAYIESWIFFS
jgi:hypothetical protein